MLPPPDPRLLFIHPHNHLLDWAIPIGAVGAANLLPRPPVGRFAGEVSREDVERASVILIGVHWFFPIGVLDEMVAALRAINPAARIVVGGLTASFYRELFARRFAVDYVCSGDVEISFPTLVAHLLDGEVPPPLPNVWTKDSGSDGRRLTLDEFAKLDWLRIDWFPSYRRRVEEQHARYRPGEVWDGLYPTIPVTRGCVRTCEFCFGGYQRRVFGPKVLLRPGERLVRDLETIAADPALRFVTLMLADACYLSIYADAVADRRFRLDAFLAFCGTADTGVLDRLRSGFAGHVQLLNIPPSELAPLRRDKPAAERDAAFAGMVQHLKTLADTRTLVFYVNRGGPDETTRALADGETTQLVSGQDWPIARPTLSELGPERGLADQLRDLVQVGKETSALHLLRALVPPLRRTLNPELDTATFLSPELTKDCDAFEQRVHGLLLDQVRERRVIGYPSLELRWFGAPCVPGQPAIWAPPVIPLDGIVTWSPSLSGLSWRGRVEVPADLAMWVTPCPRVRVGEESAAIETWMRAQLPAVPVAKGAARIVELGGESRGSVLDLWLEDGESREQWTLALPPAPHEFAAEAWPRPALVAALLHFLLGNPSLSALGWRATGYQWSRCHLTFQLASSTRTALLSLFPRAPAQKFAGSESIACTVYAPERDAQIEHLQAEIGRLVASTERTASTRSRALPGARRPPDSNR
jgi:hypothetical protein